MQRRDIIGIAQTGTGKTAAFALPILHTLYTDRKRPGPRACRVLILSPTRELSGQIRDSFKTYGRHVGFTSALVIGGVSIGGQARSLVNGVDVLVATPGRLLDLVGTHALRLNEVEMLVLDEADRMLDMGFIHDIKKIIAKLPPRRQTLFFSATMPKAIAELADQMLKDPAKVSVTPVASTAERVDQRVILVDRGAKPALLTELLRSEPVDRALVFTRTKHGADKVVRDLVKNGIAAEAIHGNKSQNQRERVLAAFRQGSIRTLVATDIAARGIDVEGISHVFNFDLPNEPESYVHRIGRTARAGAGGIAISFCDADERAFLRDIEKLIRLTIASTDRRTGLRTQPSQPHATPQPERQRQRQRPAAAAKPHRPEQPQRQKEGARQHEAPRHHARRPDPRTGDTPHREAHAEAARPAADTMAGVGFIRRPARPPRDGASRPTRWSGSA